MINSFNTLENYIETIFNENDLNTKVKITFSNLNNVDIQINSLIQFTGDDNYISICEDLYRKIIKLDIIQELEIAEKGFINIKLSDAFFQQNLINDPIKIKYQLKIDNKFVMFDYGGANIGKTLHVGHLRTLNIGRSLKNIYEIAGCKTTSDIHFGDWGIPIGLILAYLDHKSIKLVELKVSDLEYIYPNAALLASKDKNFNKDVNNIVNLLNSGDKKYIEKWKKIEKLSKDNIKQLLDLLNFKFDLYNGESDVVDLIPKLIENLKNDNLIKVDDGALIATDDQKPPAIVVKSDGSYNYLTTDLATVIDRERQNSYDEYIYVVDQRQSKHFEQLFKLVGYFSLSKSKFTHVGFGTINGLDGKPMKTREGGNYRLDTLLDDIKNILQHKNNDINTLNILANSVLTFSDLVNSRSKNYIFDLEKFTNINGKSAIYIQYSQVRAKGLLKKANTKGFFQNSSPENRDLIMELLKLNYFFNLAYEYNEPHHLGEYLYKLCQEFNSFYGSKKVFSESNSIEDTANNLYIIECFIATVEVVFECLGIELVNNM